MIVSEIANPGMLERWNCGLNSWWLISAELPKTAVNPHDNSHAKFPQIDLLFSARSWLNTNTNTISKPQPEIRSSERRNFDSEIDTKERIGSKKPIAASRLEDVHFGVLGCELARRCPYWVTDRLKDVYFEIRIGSGIPILGCGSPTW